MDQGELVADIAGGLDVSVHPGDVTSFVASNSYDTDYPNVLGYSAGLSFKWR